MQISNIKGDLMMQNNLETLQLFNVRTYQKTLTSFVEDFPVKHFQSQDYEKALMIQEVRYFLKLHGLNFLLLKILEEMV